MKLVCPPLILSFPFSTRLDRHAKMPFNYNIESRSEGSRIDMGIMFLLKDFYLNGSYFQFRHHQP